MYVCVCGGGADVCPILMQRTTDGHSFTGREVLSFWPFVCLLGAFVAPFLPLDQPSPLLVKMFALTVQTH